MRSLVKCETIVSALGTENTLREVYMTFAIGVWRSKEDNQWKATNQSLPHPCRRHGVRDEVGGARVLANAEPRLSSGPDLMPEELVALDADPLSSCS